MAHTFGIVGAEFINSTELDEPLQMLKEEGHRVLSRPEPEALRSTGSQEVREPLSTCVQTKSLAQVNCSKQVSKWEGNVRRT